jgi:mannose/fructose/N-acetylgalactosamine-specific phosphotransferase system component IID
MKKLKEQIREDPERDGGGPMVGSMALLSILLRSFTIQASWNYERMLGLGFLFSIMPGLRKISSSEDSLRDSASRHLEFFNSHPYLTSYALGSSLKMEEEYSRNGDVDEEAIRRWKKALLSPLGSLGDSLFWKSFRPLCGLLGVLLSLLLGWIGPVIYLITYNSLHLYVRTRGVFHSYAKGTESMAEFSRSLYRHFPTWLEGLICVLMGSLLVLLYKGTNHLPASSGTGVLFLLLVPVFWVLNRYFSPRFLLYATSIVVTASVVLWEIFIV